MIREARFPRTDFPLVRVGIDASAIRDFILISAIKQSNLASGVMTALVMSRFTEELVQGSTLENMGIDPLKFIGRSSNLNILLRKGCLFLIIPAQELDRSVGILELTVGLVKVIFIIN